MQTSEPERGTDRHTTQNPLQHSSEHARADFPSFSQWQAKQLSRRDIWFAIFVLCMYLAYLRKSVPAVCSKMNSTQQDRGAHNRQQRWPTLSRIICGGDEETVVPSSRIYAAAKTVLRAAVTFSSVGLLSGDPLHLLVAPLRISLLLLLLVPLPYISITAVWNKLRNNCTQQQISGVPDHNEVCSSSSSSSRRRRRRWNESSSSGSGSSSGSSSSSSIIVQWYHPDSYWRTPVFRNIVIMLQHIMPSTVSAVCLEFNARGVGWRTLVQETSLLQLIGKYWFQGWMAWLAVLPLRLHLVFNILEWAINYTFYSHTLDENGKAAGFLDAERLCVSFVCITVLSTLGVWWLENSQKKRYQQLLQQQQQQHRVMGKGPATAAAAVGGSKTELLDQQAVTASTGLTRGSSSSSSSSGNGMRSVEQQRQRWVDSCKPVTDNSSSSSSVLDERISSLLHHPQAGDGLRSEDLLDIYTSYDTTNNTPNNMTTNIASDLLGQQAAGAVAAAAAGVTGSSAVGLLSKYESVTQSMPISIKVHTCRDSVCRLSPVLSSVLHYQLMSGHNTHSEPLAIHTAAFEGCVQLVANVLGLRNRMPAAVGPNAAAAAAGDGDGGSSSSRDLDPDLDPTGSKQFAASLLARVVEAIRLLPAAAAAGPDGSSSQPDIDVTGGGSSASTRVAAAISSSSSSSSIDARISSVILRSVDPICVIADQAQDQEIRLSLTLSGEQQQQPDHARLLIFRDGTIISDINVVLDEHISFTVPPQALGVLQLALLPAAAAADSDQRSRLTTDADQAVFPAVPLLLPLLVLPAAAARDLENYHQQLRSADQHTGSSSGSSSSDGRTHSAWDTVVAVSTDVAYILSVCAAARAAAVSGSSSSKPAAAKQQIPAGVKAVLKHLLIHLAACGMVELMAHVVDTAAAVFTAADRGSSSSSEAPTDLAAAAGDDNATPTLSKDTSSGCKDTSSAAAAAARSKSSSSRSDLDLDQALDLDPLSGLNPTPNRVRASELLWGFRSSTLEARYQAAAFTNSAWLDLFLLLYVTTMSVGCVVRQAHSYNLGNAAAETALSCNARNLESNALLNGNAASNQCTAAAAAAADKPWHSPMFSDILFSLAYLSGPLPVLLLRMTVARNLQQHQQQQNPLPILLRAAKHKQIILLFWMLTVPVITAVFATSDVLVTPAWVVKAWSQRGLSRDLGCVFAVGMKGFTSQVPFAYFWPIMLVQIIISGIGSINYNTAPPYWVLLRYIPALALTLVVNVWQHVHGRGRFCTRHGIQVQP